MQSLLPAEFRNVINAPLRRYFMTTFLARFGLGLTLSMYVVYLHNVRGFSTNFATLLLGASAIAGLASSAVWGSMTDRFGPLRVAMTAYICTAGSLSLWAVAHTKTQAVVAAILLAIFSGATWGASSTMLSRLVGEEHRQRAFGFDFMLVNLGIGFGGLVSASIVDLHHPESFTVLYLFNAGIDVLAAGFFVSLHRYGGAVTEHHDDPVKSAEGWREVLRDRRLMQYVLGSLVLMIGGYGSQEAGFSLFVVNNLKLSVHVIGVIFFFNTTTIVLAQLWVLNKIEGRSRTRLMAVSSALWCVFWIILEAALALPAFFAAAALCGAMVVFAIGETMMSPVGPALVNDIAPEHLRGRYNATQGLAWGLAGSLAPAITALYFDNNLSNWWPLSTGVTSLAGGLIMLNLRRRLNPREDGRVVSVEV
ncbi:MAG: MFS transporter [Acidimicrobiales bacterium]